LRGGNLMSTIKISELPAILGANTAATDVIPIVDVSGNITNKITREEFFKNVPDMEINDKIIHSGDTNTAIRFPAADTVTVETAGAERLRVDSSGNVGIGTSSPGFRLDSQVSSTSTNDQQVALRLKSTTTADMINGFGVNTLYSIQDSSGANFNIAQLRAVRDGADDSGAFVFAPYSTGAASERMRITSGGDVGIGTGSPDAKLRVNGGGSSLQARFSGTNGRGLAISTFTSASTTDNGVIYNAGVFADAQHVWQCGGTERMRIDSSGNVGIGTTSPAGKLDVSATTYSRFLNTTAPTLNNDTHAGEALYLRSGGTDGSGNVQAVLAFGKADSSSQRSGAAIASIQTTTDADQIGLGFYVSSGTSSSQTMTQAAIITSAGNVGIGTSSPAVKLHLGGSSDQSFEIDGSLTPTFVGTSGNVGQISVNRRPHDGAFADTGKAAAYINLISEAGGSTITLSTTTTNNVNPSERARIDSSGNLLVGTTSTSPTSGNGVKVIPGTGAQVSIVGSADTNANLAMNVYSTTAAAYRFQVGWGGTIYATSTSITAISDASLKENVRDLETGLDEVMALRPRRFDWKNGDGQDVAGFIAQEVESVLPDLVSDYKYNAEETKRGLKMGDMLPTLVKAIQELKAEVDSLRAQLNP
jgi:hypothetical protein